MSNENNKRNRDKKKSNKQNLSTVTNLIRNIKHSTALLIRCKNIEAILFFFSALIAGLDKGTDCPPPKKNLNQYHAFFFNIRRNSEVLSTCQWPKIELLFNQLIKMHTGTFFIFNSFNHSIAHKCRIYKNCFFQIQPRFQFISDDALYLKFLFF